MATYCNKHWLLSHIRNSFISTDDTGMCETVMASDDLPKHYLKNFRVSAKDQNQQHHSLQPVDFVCYPGLDQSDDEDLDLSTQSFDIQMYPEVGAHRLRSNTAQKLEKMDIARRKAARTKCVNFDDEIVPPERTDFFVRKALSSDKQSCTNEPKVFDGEHQETTSVRSKLAFQLANTPKQAQNKFMEYARFDGTSQTGIHTKRINVFLSMLPEHDRNFPIKICVLASAKIIEVIGLVCYKATIQYPEIPLKSIRHYALYMTEDNDDMEDFPPLDNREPCSKFGFSQLTLAERRPLAPVTRIDYHNNQPTKSMTSEEDKARIAAAALHGLELNVIGDDSESPSGFGESNINEFEERMISHNERLEAPMYRTYHVHIIDKRFFKTEVTLGISSDRIEIDQHKNAKFWTKQKAVTYTIEAIGFCEIVERRHTKAVFRIWLRSSSNATALSSSTSTNFGVNDMKAVGSNSTATAALSGGGAGNLSTSPHSPTSPSHYPSSPFTFSQQKQQQPHQPIRFKHYDFEADQQTIEQICNKLNCILEVRSSEVRSEFIQMRERKSEKIGAKKSLKI